MQLQRYVRNDLHDSGISEGKLAHWLHINRSTLSSRLCFSITPKFYDDCEKAIAQITRERAKRFTHSYKHRIDTRRFSKER